MGDRTDEFELQAGRASDVGRQTSPTPRARWRLRSGSSLEGWRVVVMGDAAALAGRSTPDLPNADVAVRTATSVTRTRLPGSSPQAAAALGGIDALVNCASAFALADDDAGWSASIAVDLMGSVRSGQAALSSLRASAHAPIINMSSVSALRAPNGRAPYGAVKDPYLGAFAP